MTNDEKQHVVDVKGVDVDPGDDICFFYSGIEQRDGITTFSRCAWGRTPSPGWPT